jgi:hypothetical protein
MVRAFTYVMRILTRFGEASALSGYGQEVARSGPTRRRSFCGRRSVRRFLRPKRPSRSAKRRSDRHTEVSSRQSLACFGFIDRVSLRQRAGPKRVTRRRGLPAFECEPSAVFTKVIVCHTVLGRNTYATDGELLVPCVMNVTRWPWAGTGPTSRGSRCEPCGKSLL